MPQTDWPEVVVIWAPFERQKIEVHIFERTNLSCFGTWKFTAKEDLNPRKQVFLLNSRLWLAHKPKIWSFFYRKKFMWENSILWKLGTFSLKISTLPRLLIVAIRVAYLVAFTTMAKWLACEIWSVAQSVALIQWFTNPKSWHGFSG